VQIWQDKTHDADTNTEAAKAAHKAATNAASVTRIPMWANARGEHAPTGLQAKLTINQPGDVYEQEADRVAEQVMRMPLDQMAQGTRIAGSPGTTFVQRQVVPDEEPREQRVREVGAVEVVEETPEEAEETGEGETDEGEEAVQAKEVQGQTPHVTPQLQTHIDTMRGGGQALPASTRAFMEPRFGYDFGQVRVHTHEQATQSAESMNALAYTSGRDIVFGPGQYRPETTAGQQLLAHELTHVVQQEQDALSLQSMQRKIKIQQGTGPAATWHEMTRREAERFVKRRFAKRRWHLALLIVDEMFSSGDDFKFDDTAEFYREIFKRVRTSQLIKESQENYGKFGAFGYPAKNHDGQVNLAARAYWGPAQHDAIGLYFFELSSAGRNNPYQALVTLFVRHRHPENRTLIHCDYLASMIHMLVFAESIGATEFNKRVKNGTIPFTLKWNGFDDIQDLIGKPASQVSIQAVRPSSEKDIVIGDHVVFWNHRAYDLINSEKHNAWRLENAFAEDKQGSELIFEGHGSLKRTNRGMRAKLMEEFNDLVKIAERLIKHHQLAELTGQFPVLKLVGGKWRIQGFAHSKSIDMELKQLTDVNDPELIGLKDPDDPAQMNYVRRPVESK